MDELKNYTTTELLTLNSKGIEGLAYSLRSSVKINEYDFLGQVSFKFILLLLEHISKKMKPWQTLKDFFE